LVRGEKPSDGAPKEFTRRRLIGGASAAAILSRVPWPGRVRAADPAGRVTYWHHLTSQTEFAGLKRVIAQFERRYPAVDIVQEPIPSAEFMAKFNAAVLSGSRPDTLMITAGRFADMVATGGLVDLTDRIENGKLRSDFPADAFRAVTREGRVYGVPAFAFVQWMYYRRDWFDEAGIDGPPDTMAAFLEAARKLTDPASGRYGFGMRAGDGGHLFVIEMMRAFGSPLVEDGLVAIDRNKAIEGVRFYADLYTRYRVAPPSAPADSYRQIMEGFRTGQTGMIWHHTGSLREIADALPKGSFMTAIQPAGPAARIAEVAYLYNGLMQRENADAAWAWVSFWGETDAALAMLEKTGYFPAVTAAANLAHIASNPMYAAAVKTFEFGGPPPDFPGADAWGRKVVMPEFQKILIGATIVEDAVDAMIRGLEATVR
jgi:multiple sugar transport system substrate-binding protein